MLVGDRQNEAPAPASPPAQPPGRYPRPRATVDPDRSKGWVRRVWPIIVARRRAVLVAIGVRIAAWNQKRVAA